MVNGQSDIGLDIPCKYYLDAKAKAAPINMVFPVEGGISIPRNAAMFKQAKNPNAARLFVAWLFTEEGQKSIVTSGLQGTMPGARAVEGTPPGMQLHPIDWMTLKSQYNGYLTTFQKIFKQ
ncbi:ABC-type Fe3+ transport system substrate-binding protein [Neorhizobium galegae]|uniref:extracellular solute-binding protein n=1 Tax=Neorhizobium galegae TaxID=399 RepID=UPI002782D0EC|nr:extracellular solute-binding protein [Neorhizobium galegae]MDQ0137720.1 ABC-type Fe3+ transport system substrate-binding protein [Neorhizobium galegae]